MTVKIFPNTKIIGQENIEFGHDIIIDDFVFINAKTKIKLGNFVHIGCFSSISANDYIELGDFIALSHGVRIFTASDDYVNWGFGNSTTPLEYRNIKQAPIIIGKFSIIGANSVILPGVKIGEGASVGACSVITTDLEPWGVYIGNKKVKMRDKKGVLKNYENFLANY